MIQVTYSKLKLRQWAAEEGQRMAEVLDFQKRDASQRKMMVKEGK